MQTAIVTATDTGMVRQRNEDYVMLDPARGVAVLCDGMGGHLAGDVASRLGAEAVMEALCDPGPEAPDVAARLREAVETANRVIIEAARERPEWTGMGATVVAAVFGPDTVHAAHLGDSRLYRLRDGELDLLTEDHTVSQQYVRRGVLSADAAQGWIGRSMLLRALGIDDDVDVDVTESALMPDDCFLLCTDGLTDACSEDQIREELCHLDTELEEIAARLIDLANANGGPDNVTVVLARVAGDGDGPEAG